MKHYFKIFTICFSLLAGVCSCSDDDSNSLLPQPEPADNGYCLMFYASGGDPEHDLSIMSSITQAAQATADRSDLAVTCLFKSSGMGEGEAHNGIRRYKGDNGTLTQDNSCSFDADFDITDPTNLTDFIRWSAEQYPNRKYLFVFAGHGLTFIPQLDLPDSRATIWDGSKCMSSIQLAQGIRDAGIHLDAMIAHSCQQGSIEMLAEWEGLADYLLGSPFSIPDFAYDYYSLLIDLSEGHMVEEALVRTARRTMNLWQEMHDNNHYGTVVEVTRLNDLTPLWDALRKTFDYMESSLDGVNCTTDPPAILGETYKTGYRNALLHVMPSYTENDFFETLRADWSVDLPDFLRNAYVYSGNIELAPYVNRVQEVIDEMLVIHLQSNGLHDFTYNVYVNPTPFGTEMDLYRTCRFDQLTGWSKLFVSLFNFSAGQEKRTIMSEAGIDMPDGLDARAR